MPLPLPRGQLPFSSARGKWSAFGSIFSESSWEVCLAISVSYLQPSCSKPLHQVSHALIFFLCIEQLVFAGLDYLTSPTGAIAEAQEKAAQTFGADQTWFLVNGSTVGIQASTV